MLGDCLAPSPFFKGGLMKWYLMRWTGLSPDKKPMTPKEMVDAIKFLRRNNYPKPADCLKEKCDGYRPACGLGVCYVAVKLCGDF
jgi:hypothetical protein